MIVRTLTLVGALLGGAGMSQFPEYAQQYEQRLAGAVDEMRVVVQNFDNALDQLGQTREQAFAPGQVLSDREGKLLGNARTNIDRLAFLEKSLAKVQNASTFDQLVSAPRVLDQKVAARAYDDFKPAIPLTVEGIACAGLGFIAGWIIFGLLFRFLAFPFRRKQKAKA